MPTFRFLLPKRLRRFLRPIAYQLLATPHGKKVKDILEQKTKHKISLFVETGTYLGDTVDSVADQFKKIYSIICC